MNKSFILESKQQIEDFVLGCTFYGTGGGGDYDEGVEALTKQLDKGNKIGWTHPDDISDGGYSCCPFLMGSIAPETPEVKREREVIYGLGDQTSDYTQAMVGAIRELEKIKKKKIAVLVPIELGGGNTASCIAAAAEMNVTVVDGDYTGRAIPEIQQTTPYIFEKELLPIASYDCWDNIATIQDTVNWRMAERIGKMISAGGFSKCAQAGFHFPVSEMKKILVRLTLSECYEVGKSIREAVQSGSDPAESVVAKTGGWIIMRGTVTNKEYEDKQGYYWGTHTFTGVDKYANNELKIWFKNENHVSWLNGEPYVTSPDMLQVIDSRTGHPYTNNKITVGMDVTVIAMKAREVFKSKRGLSILSARVFDFDIPYTPVEIIMDK